MVLINGEEKAAAGQNLKEYLAGRGYVLTRIAVERNGLIVPKADYGRIILQEGDSLEIVSVVGGG